MINKLGRTPRWRADLTYVGAAHLTKILQMSPEDPALALLIHVLVAGFSFGGYVGWGRILGFKHAVEAGMVALFSFSAAFSSFYWLAPGIVRPLTNLVIASGWVVLGYQAWEHRARLWRHARKTLSSVTQVKRLTSAAIGLAITWRFAGPNYIFETHDLIYFGWISTFWSPNSLELEFSWPMQMGASNAMAGLSTALLLGPGPNASLLATIDARFLILLVGISSIMHRLIQSISGKIFSVIAGIGFSSLIWLPDVGYELLISSYPAVLLLGFVSISVIESRHEPTLTAFQLFLVALNKALLFPAIAVAIFAAATFSRIRLRRCLSTIAVALGIASVASWLFAPKGQSASELDFSILGMGSGAQASEGQIYESLIAWLRSFSGVIGWNLDYVTHLIGLINFNSRILLVLCILVWMAIKLPISYVFVVRSLAQVGSEKRVPNKNLILLNWWVVVILLSFIFVRNGPHVDLGQQAHGYLLMSTPLWVLASYTIARHTFFEGSHASIPKKLLTLLGAGALVLNLIWYSPTGDRATATSAIRLSDLEVLSAEIQKTDGFLLSNSVPYERLQVYSALVGERVAFKAGYEDKSVVDRFLVSPE